MVYEGARKVSKEEAKNEAVRQAKKSGHDMEALDVLLVEHELPRIPGILRVDKDLRNLVMEPHSLGPRRAGRAVKERRKVAPPRTRGQKPPTRRKKTWYAAASIPLLQSVTNAVSAAFYFRFFLRHLWTRRKLRMSLAYDPFQPELADSLEHPVAMTFGMFDVLDAVQGTKLKFAER
jgi:hypothetical protein